MSFEYPPSIEDLNFGNITKALSLSEEYKFEQVIGLNMVVNGLCYVVQAQKTGLGYAQRTSDNFYAFIPKDEDLNKYTGSNIRMSAGHSDNQIGIDLRNQNDMHIYESKLDIMIDSLRKLRLDDPVLDEALDVIIEHRFDN